MKRENGFSLIELLVTLSIAGVILSLALLVIPTVLHGNYEKSVVSKFAMLQTAQKSYRFDLGNEYYATLSQLASAKAEGLSIIDQSLIDASGNPVNYHGWQIEQLETPGRRNFGYRLCSGDTANYDYCYLMYEDGPVRKLSRTATAARNTGTAIE